jgi:hypothetical protein
LRFAGTTLIRSSVQDDGRIGSVTVLSEPYLIDRIFESMKGPVSTQYGIHLLSAGEPTQLLWITTIRTDVVGADGKTPQSSEFFCHSNLSFARSGRLQRDADGAFTAVPDLRLATLVPGHLEIGLPDGFGIPVYSDEPLDYFGMALSLNQVEVPTQIRFKTTMSFVRDAAASRKSVMRPLFRRALYGYEAPSGAGDPATAHAGHAGTSEGSSMAQPALGPLPPSAQIHWTIPPGRYEGTVSVTDQLGALEDTTIHYATAHLHPYARSVSLIDRTTRTVVVTIRSRDRDGRRGVDVMDEFHSDAGIPIDRSHQYDLVTVYENTTSGPVDAMSIMYLYMVDNRFARTLLRQARREHE